MLVVTCFERRDERVHVHYMCRISASTANRPVIVDVPTTQFEDVLAPAQQGARWAIAVLWRELHPRLRRSLHGFDPLAAEDVEADTGLSRSRPRDRSGGASPRSPLSTFPERRER